MGSWSQQDQKRFIRSRSCFWPHQLKSDLVSAHNYNLGLSFGFGLCHIKNRVQRLGCRSLGPPPCRSELVGPILETVMKSSKLNLHSNHKVEKQQLSGARGTCSLPKTTGSGQGSTPTFLGSPINFEFDLSTKEKQARIIERELRRVYLKT